MDAILSSIKLGRIRNAKPCIVISNKPEVPGLKIASEKYGVTTKIVPSDGLKGWHYDQNLVEILHQNGVTPQSGLVCLAGFMRIISPEFVRYYRMRIMNMHPALLPAFPGLHAQKQALDYGVKVTGCTVHFVDEGIDSGPVILQKAVPVLEGDDEESLSERILQKEHEIYPEAVRLFCDGRIKIEGRRVSIT